jgi:uncharacterized membrane protein YcaP (DUF421 family)
LRASFCHPERVFGLTTPWWEIILRTAVVYVVVLVLLRVAGKRELGQMSPVDLVVILVIANAVQNAMTGGDNSLIGGIIAATTLVAMNIAFSRVAHRIPYIAHLFESEPTRLVKDGKLIKRNLDQENVDMDELMMAAREHGIDDLDSVEGAYLERDGSISIIPKGKPAKAAVRRHIRQFRQR